MNEVMSVRCVRMNEAERRVVYWLHGRTHDETDVFTNILLIVATMVATINSTAPRPLKKKSRGRPAGRAQLCCCC